MFELKIRAEKITQDEYDGIEKHFSEQQEIFRLFAIKGKLSQRLWQKKCVKHRPRNSNFQGFWATNWEKINNAKRR